MPDGTSFVVNLDSLGALGKRVETIRSVFDQMGAHPPVDADAVGDPSLAAELEGFLDGWSQGRQHISASLRAVGEALANALAVYSQADRTIALGAAGGSAPSPGGAAGPAQT